MPAKRTRRRLIVLAVATIVVAWLVACAALLWSAKGDAETGLDAMNDFSSLASTDISTFVESIGGQQDDVAEETGEQRLRDAADAFEQANASVSSPLLVPMRFVPVLGRQVRSVDALSAAAATTAADAATAFGDLTALLDASTNEPGDRLATTAEVERILTTLQTGIDELDLGPSEALVGPLARARERFVDEYEQVMATLDDAVVAITGVHDFLEGPSRYLVMAANNAEMRAGSGMFLQMGSMDVAGGQFTLGEFEATADLKLPTPGAALDPDLAALWGPLEPTQDWRNLNVTPRFDETARMATEMWAASGRGEVDGVLAVDVVGLRRLLELVGPVEVDGVDGPTTITAENVQSQLLLEQYAGADDDVEGARRAQLGRVASAVFESFNQRSVSATQLLQVLQDTGAGRHLLLWSSVPEQQAAWEALGASGRVPENALMVSVLNRGGNKLDQFLSTRAALSAVDVDDTMRRVTVRVDMTNDAPGGLPRYVGGPYPGTDFAAGEYIGLLAVTVPSGAGNPAVDGAELVGTAVDGDSRVLVSRVRLPRGASGSFTVSFDLPSTWATIDVLPSARVPATEWSAGDLAWSSERSQVVELDALG